AAYRPPIRVSLLYGFPGRRLAGGVWARRGAVEAAAEDLSGPSAPLWSATAVLLLIVAGLAVARPVVVVRSQEEK
ncbi:hypothetical protein, partial [Nocardia farcinica]|uniref:hypothetical protein n=1 Tax=Nocardia farcinica TaxID=37329 RepID=UPI0024576E89